MPTRDIKTRLVIEGENEYKAAISKINGELKLLDSALKETESRFQTNANTMEALQKRSEALTAVQEAQQRKVEETARALDNARQAVESYSQTGEDLQRKLQEENARWEALNATRKASAEETAAHEKAVGDLNRQIGENSGMLEAAQKSAQGWETSLNKANTQLNGTKAELDQTNGYLEEAKNSTDGCATSIDQFGNKAKEAGDKASGALDMLAGQVAFQTIKKGFDEIRQAITECIDASIEFESAMAGVAKTTDLTDDELAAMGDALQEMSTRIPTAASDLAAITEAAGQLGIEKDHLLAFTEVMANLGVATNLSAEEAASALAKFANVVKMDADNYDRLGSVIVALGNNFATTESDIVSMATRIASTGAIIDLTEPQIMAIATALSSVGIEAEAGGSAISKLLKKMEVSAQSYEKANDAIGKTGKSLRELEMLADQDSKGFKELAGSLGMTSGELKGFMEQKKTLEQFADVAGMTAEAFIDLWGRDAVQALDAFIGGLNDTDRTGQSAVETLNDMGLTEIRLSNAVLSLASNGHILTDSVELANQAWDENNALAKEAATRYETTESKMQLLDNSVQALKASIGDQLTPALKRAADTGIELTGWAKGFIDEHPWVVQAIGAVTGALAGISGAAVGAKVISTVLIPLFSSLTTPAGLAAIAIAGITGALIALNALAGEKTPDAMKAFEDKTHELTKAADDVAESIRTSRDAYQENLDAMKAQDDEIDRMTERVEKLAAKEKLSDGEKATMLDLIKRLNAAVPDLNLHYEEETKQLNLSTEAIRKKIEARRDEEKLTALMERQIEIEEQIAQAQKVQDDLIAQKADALRGIQEAQDRYNAAEEKTANLAYECSYAIDSYNAALEELDPAIDSNYGQMQSLREEYAQAEADVEELAGTVNELAEAEKEAADAAAEAEKKTEEALEDAKKAAREAVDDALDRIDKLKKAYDDSYKAAYTALMGTMDLWGEVEDKQTVSIENMILNLQKQMAADTDYFDNLLALEQANSDGRIRISDAMREKLSENTEESRLLAQKLMDALNEGEDELVKVLARVMDDFDQQKEKQATVLAEFSTNFNSSMEKIDRDTKEELRNIAGNYSEFADEIEAIGRQAGLNFGAGLAAGITLKIGVAEQAARDMGRKAAAALNRTIEAASPAKVTIRSGEYFGEGFAVGITNEDGTVKAASEKLAKGAMSPIDALKSRLQGMKGELVSIAEAILSEIGSKASATESIAERIRSAVFGAGSAASAGTGLSWQGFDGMDANTRIRALQTMSGTDYSAMMLAAGSLSEFQAAQALRDQKIAALGIDLAEKGWRSNDELYAEWMASRGWSMPDLTPQPVGNAAAAVIGQISELLDRKLGGGKEEEYLAIIAANSQKNLYINGKALVGALTPELNDALGTQYNYDGRGI